MTSKFYLFLLHCDGMRWCRRIFCALQMQPEGRWFESTSSHCIATLDKLLTCNCLWGRQWETTSLISSPGGVKANELACGQRTLVILVMTSKLYMFLFHYYCSPYLVILSVISYFEQYTASCLFTCPSKPLSCVFGHFTTSLSTHLSLLLYVSA